MKSIVTLCLAVLLLSPAAASAADTPGEFPLTVHEKVLANGLKILVIPREGVPSSPCAIAYAVGSVNERVGQTGMAHYLEHMMFKGTGKVGVKDLAVDERLRKALDEVIAEKIRLEDGPGTPETAARLDALAKERDRLIDEQKQNLEINHVFTIYREAGSSFTNAMTSNDMTVYIASLPPEKLELFFWVESDRMRNIVFRQFHAEKDVVREERRMYENRPGALFGEEVSQALFGAHPYAHPVLGYHEDLRAMTRPELRAFWSTYYSPDNAVVYVGGDVDPEKVFALADKYFGFIPASTRKRPRIPMLRITKNGEIRMHGSGPGQASIDIDFRVPAAGSSEALALNFLASHLGDAEGPLVKDLVEKDKLAVSLRARYNGRKYGGVLNVSATLSPTGTHEAVEIRILEAIAALRDAPLGKETMDGLRRRYRARILGAVRREMMVGFMILSREVTGSWRDIERDLVRARTLGADELQAAAKSYLVRENGVVSLYSKESRAAEVVPTVPDAPAPAPEKPAAKDAGLPGTWNDLEYETRGFELPSAAKSRHVFSNGIRAFIVPNVGDPVFRISARILGGSAEDPVGKEGLSDLAASLLGEAGIPGLDGEALREHLEGIVGSVGTSSDLISHSINVTVFPSDTCEGFRILRLLLAEPKLDPEDLDRIRRRMISRIESSEDRIGPVTARLYGRLLWGDVPETRRATVESLESITIDDIRKRLAAVTAPDRIILSVSGDIDVTLTVALIDEALGSFAPKGAAAYQSPKGKNDAAATARGLHLRAMPTSQGSVRIGTVTVPRGHADAPALRTLSAILTRRIFNQIRSVHGLSYQAGARFAPSWRNDSRFTVTFQTKCASVPFAVRLAKQEIAKMIAEGPTATEMKDALGALETSFRRTFGRGFDSAEVFADLEARSADLAYHATLRNAYQTVTADRVKEVAARYLSPDRLLVLCVGNIDEMRPGDGVHADRLEDSGEATVH
jgi:predicted Zn-dependent peptidase